MSAIDDLRSAILDSKVHGLDVMEIHANRNLYADVCSELMITSPFFPHTPQIDGIPIKVTRHEGTGFHFVVIPKELPEGPAEPTTLFGYPVVFTDSPAFRWPRRASFRDVELSERAIVSDTIVSALRSELHEAPPDEPSKPEPRQAVTRTECGECPCLRGDGSLWGHSCGAGYEIVQAMFPYSFSCGMVAIVTREKSLVFNHKYDG